MHFWNGGGVAPKMPQNLHRGFFFDRIDGGRRANPYLQGAFEKLKPVLKHMAYLGKVRFK